MKSLASSKTSGKPKLVLHTIPEMTADGRQTMARYWFIGDDRRIFRTGCRVSDWKGARQALMAHKRAAGPAMATRPHCA